MFVVAGLGNPGVKYALTRHNIGFWTIDELGHRGQARVDEAKCRSLLGKTVVAGREVVLVKPMMYMNRSGLAVAAVLRHFSLSPDRLLVIYDDLDLPLGRIRLRPSGGSGGHRGLASIIACLATEEFARLRLGIGTGEGTGGETSDYVLSPFKPEEEELAHEQVLRAADAVETLLSSGMEEAMNRFNSLRLADM